MEIRRCEKKRIAGVIAMLAFAQVSFEAGSELRFVEKGFVQCGKQRSKPRDRGGENNPFPAQNSSRLSQTGKPLYPFGQMIKRAQEQHGVHRAVAKMELARVPQSNASQRWAPGLSGPLRLLNVFGNRIKQVHFVTQSREPECIGPRTPAGIHNHRRGWWQMPQDQLLRARKLQLKTPSPQTRVFVDGLIVCHDILQRVCWHIVRAANQCVCPWCSCPSSC